MDHGSAASANQESKIKECSMVRCDHTIGSFATPLHLLSLATTVIRAVPGLPRDAIGMKLWLRCLRSLEPSHYIMNL